MSLKQAFENTSFFVSLPSGLCELRHGLPCPEEISQIVGDRPWAIITAFNPQGYQVSEAENWERHGQLITETGSLTRMEAYGTAPKWQREYGFLLVGINLEKACEIGRKFDQAAIVYGTHTPQIIFI